MNGSALLLVGLLLSPFACMAQSVTVLASELNGRDRPDMEGIIEARFFEGEALEAVSLSGNWVEVEGGETGTVWCSADYLTEREPFEATNTSGGRVHIRETPDGKHIGYVGRGKSVTIERCVFGWGYMGTGWVALKHFSE